MVINPDKKPAEGHRGRFNAPSTSEIAIVIAGQQFGQRDVVLHKRDNQLMRIKETHRSYDPLQYPLMFFDGSDGYNINVPIVRKGKRQTDKVKFVSASSYYAYRLMIRKKLPNHLLYYRKLLNQFVVDMYAKIESERLAFLRHHQTDLRVTEYGHIQDAINRGDADPANLGKMVVLPSSFTGGPRFMHSKAQDAMVYVRKYGKPDLFITFTCNPQWSEIKENLFARQTPSDRQDLIARVFRLKIKTFIDIVKGGLFGEVLCYVYTVEWQKRGLPHIHSLVWLAEKLRANHVDSAIKAEIPDPTLDPILHQIVSRQMIHGPCGAFNPTSPCMKNGSCTKRFPKSFIKETQIGNEGYPTYKRRSPQEGGFTTKIKDVEVDNRWVVPYNPVLLRLFNAHINVEFCQSVKSIKYICDYINKGADQAAFAVENKNDEISSFQTGRLVICSFFSFFSSIFLV